jgi:hypothetical protein
MIGNLLVMNLYENDAVTRKQYYLTNGLYYIHVTIKQHILDTNAGK